MDKVSTVQQSHSAPLTQVDKVGLRKMDKPLYEAQAFITHIRITRTCRAKKEDKERVCGCPGINISSTTGDRAIALTYMIVMG
jgi:hypothetical protein